MTSARSVHWGWGVIDQDDEVTQAACLYTCLSESLYPHVYPHAHTQAKEATEAEPTDTTRSRPAVIQDGSRTDRSRPDVTDGSRTDRSRTNSGGAVKAKIAVDADHSINLVLDAPAARLNRAHLRTMAETLPGQACPYTFPYTCLHTCPYHYVPRCPVAGDALWPGMPCGRGCRVVAQLSVESLTCAPTRVEGHGSNAAVMLSFDKAADVATKDLEWVYGYGRRFKVLAVETEESKPVFRTTRGTAKPKAMPIHMFAHTSIHMSVHMSLHMSTHVSKHVYTRFEATASGEGFNVTRASI